MVKEESVPESAGPSGSDTQLSERLAIGAVMMGSAALTMRAQVTRMRKFEGCMVSEILIVQMDNLEK